MANIHRAPSNNLPGIFLSNSLLADDSMSLTAKIVYQILRREVGNGREIDAIHKTELATLTGLSARTIQRANFELRKKGCLPISTPFSNVNEPGIMLPGDLLADTTLSLEEKVIYCIIKMEIGAGKNTTITNSEMAKRTCIGKSTLSRIIKSLEKAGKIAVVWDNTAFLGKHGFNPTPNTPTTRRYIYLRKRLAGYRKGQIAKRHNRLTKLHNKRLRKDLDKSLGTTNESEAEANFDGFHGALYEESFNQDLARMTDEQIAEIERNHDLAPGTYIERRRKYLKERERRAKTDDLFDS